MKTLLKINQSPFKGFCFILVTIIIFQCFSPSFVKAAKSPSINRQNLTLLLYTNDPDLFIPKYYLKIENAPSRPKWSSSNEKVVTVNKNGTVIGKSKGKAEITAAMGKTKLTCKVTVIGKPDNSTLEKAVKVKSEVLENYCCLTFTSSSSYYLRVDVLANQYDSNGNKVDNKNSKIKVYLTGKGTYHYYYKLQEKTKYVDIENVDVSLENSFLELNENRFINSGVDEIVKLKSVSVTVSDIKYDWLSNGEYIPYEIVNNTAFPVEVAYQFVFFKDGKVIYVYNNIIENEDYYIDETVDAYSTLSNKIDFWPNYEDSNKFKDEEGSYSYDKCEIITLFTMRRFDSND